MGPIVVHADDELALIQFLSAVRQVTDLVPASRVTTELPNKPTFPAVLISRIAGEGIWPALDEPVVAVDVYGTSKQNAKQVMQVVRGALLAIANDRVAECVLVSAVEELGPQWLPDMLTVPPVPRYTAHYRVLTHT